jgi:hypothetical protein
VANDALWSGTHMFKDPDIRALVIHLAIYVGVIAVLGVINLMTAPADLWFLWVVMGWGIGVAAHTLALLLQKTRRRERIFIDPKARGFAVHLFVYVAVSLLLVLVNLTATPEVWWFYWPMLGWGAGMLAQAWCVMRADRPQTAQAIPPAPQQSHDTSPDVRPRDV